MAGGPQRVGDIAGVFFIWCYCHSTALNHVQEGDGWWEMVRGCGVAVPLLGCGFPNGFSVHQPGRVSPAGVRAQQTLEDTSPGPLACAQLESWGSCSCSAPSSFVLL